MQERRREIVVHPCVQATECKPPRVLDQVPVISISNPILIKNIHLSRLKAKNLKIPWNSEFENFENCRFCMLVHFRFRAIWHLHTSSDDVANDWLLLCWRPTAGSTYLLPVCSSPFHRQLFLDVAPNMQVAPPNGVRTIPGDITVISVSSSANNIASRYNIAPRSDAELFGLYVVTSVGTPGCWCTTKHKTQCKHLTIGCIFQSL